MRVEIDGWSADELYAVVAGGIVEFPDVDAPVVEVPVLLEVEDGSNVVFGGQMGNVGTGAGLAADNNVLTDVMVVKACKNERYESEGACRSGGNG